MLREWTQCDCQTLWSTGNLKEGRNEVVPEGTEKMGYIQPWVKEVSEWANGTIEGNGIWKSEGVTRRFETAPCIRGCVNNYVKFSGEFMAQWLMGCDGELEPTKNSINCMVRMILWNFVSWVDWYVDTSYARTMMIYLGESSSVSQEESAPEEDLGCTGKMVWRTMLQS
jgi:hypothetical protein